MRKIITLRAASALDDIRCADGEVEGSAFLFDDGDATGDDTDPENPDSPPNPGDSDATDPLYRIALRERWPVPAGARFLALHSPAGLSSPNALLSLADGSLAFVPTDASLAAAGRVSVPLSPAPVADVGKVVAVGDMLAVLAPGRLLFARWEGSAYRWLGASPAAPSVDFTAVPKALPPFSSVDGDLPRFTVAAGVGTDINAAVRQRQEEFLKAVEAAGLWFRPVRVCACREAADGTLWQQGDVAVLGGEEPPELRTVGSEYHDGVTYLTVEISRSPFAVKGVPRGADTASGWPDAAVRWLFCGLDEDFPPMASALDPADGSLSDVFSVGGRLLAVGGAGADAVSVSRFGSPFIAERGEALRLPAPVLCLTGSLRSGVSEALQPLYAFCGDGIRLLSPGGGGAYREAQLLSRHVALGRDVFAPLPDGTAFLTASGAVKVGGASVKALSLPAVSAPQAAHRLVYLYAEDELRLLGPGGEEGILERHYAWPEVWVQSPAGIGPARLERVDPEEAGADGGAERESARPAFPDMVRFSTRPLKLTDAFEVKRLEEVEALWPDGSRHSVRVWGAMRLGVWRCLGASPGGHMRLRGSGWRFFRLESFAKRVENSYLLPQFLINFTK